MVGLPAISGEAEAGRRAKQDSGSGRGTAQLEQAQEPGLEPARRQEGGDLVGRRCGDKGTSEQQLLAY